MLCVQREKKWRASPAVLSLSTLGRNRKRLGRYMSCFKQTHHKCVIQFFPSAHVIRIVCHSIYKSRRSVPKQEQEVMGLPLGLLNSIKF